MISVMFVMLILCENAISVVFIFTLYSIIYITIYKIKPRLRGPLSKIHPSVFGRKNKFSSYFVYELDFGQH